jgi:hypothetical protein
MVLHHHSNVVFVRTQPYGAVAGETLHERRSMKKLVVVLLLVSLVVLFLATMAFATWTPLVTSDMFTGIQTDVGTVVAAMLTVFVLILGFAILTRVFTR